MTDPRGELQRLFGFDDFRPGQREAVEAALAARDSLVVMPTGAGKSLCYQLPALMAEGGLTVVVSPLVSLMQDQVDGLRRIAADRVALVNAQRDAADNRETLRRAVDGELSLLYVAPERFASPGFARELKEASIRLFVVDEAHCVSQWGHDFRPDYFRLADAARWLGVGAIMAATATATPEVARDIVRRLGLQDPVRVATGFDRPNLSLHVVQARGDRERRVEGILAEEGSLPAIVYAGTRKATNELSERLTRKLGVEALAYHAGLPREKRAEVQERFMTGQAPIVVATNAFGMGVDKADVRTVVHASVPGSLEAWYQEAGRAGRDGQPARAILLAEPKDKALHVWFIQRGATDDGELQTAASRIERAAEDGRFDLPLKTIAGPGDGDADDRARSFLGHLARGGMLRLAPSPPDRAIGRVVASFDGSALALARASAKEAEQVRWKQYRTVWGWVEGDTCRRAGVLRHFGDTPHPERLTVPCCDICAPESAPAGTKAPALEPIAEGDLDAAILGIVARAEPAVGRTRAVEILRGGRSQVVAKFSYDGLPNYGAYAHLRADDVMARVDALLEDGTLRSTGGRFPKLAAA